MTTTGKAYPFTSKGQIRDRMASEPAFVIECATILQERTQQRVEGRAPDGKAWGWMSSERVVAGRITEQARAGTTSTVDMAKLQRMVGRYSKQIADHFRTERLALEPGLAETAKLFSVSVPSAATSVAPARVEDPVAPVAADHEADESEPDSEEEPASDSVPPADLVARVLVRLREQPGSRTEELAAFLGATTADVGAAVRSLLADKKATKRGQARGTRYFAK